MSAEINKTNVTSSNSVYTAKVNVWDTDPQTGRCGHASVSLQEGGEGGSTKFSKYMGMWPKYGWMVNLFTLPFAFPGTYLKSKKACMDREGDEGPLKPSRQYQVELSPTQYGAMKGEMDRIKGKIKNGTTLYTLFSEFNVFSFAKRIAKPYIMEQLHACPFTGLPMDHPTLIDDCQVIKEIETDNCTTLAIKVLNAGGINVKKSSMPWGLAPSSLGHQLERLQATDSSISKKVIESKVINA